MHEPTGTRDTKPTLEQLTQLEQALLELHKRLLTNLQQAFEKVYGRVEGPGALWQLAIHDPLFAWLQPLTQLITQLDDLRAGNVGTAELAQARERITRLLEDESDFSTNYRARLQSDPDVVVAHGAVVRKLKGFD